MGDPSPESTGNAPLSVFRDRMMAHTDFVAPQATELLQLLADPHAETQGRLLDRYLHNPFLDDDAAALALRVGVTAEAAAAGLLALCRQGILREDGRRGHALASRELGPESLVAAGAGNAAAPVDAVQLPAAELSPEALLAASTAVQSGDVAQLATPPETVPPEIVDSDQGGQCPPLAASTLMGPEQAHLQEELFGQLRARVAQPMVLIQQFLDSLDAEGLGPARAALAQVKAFLDEYFLDDFGGSRERPDATN